MGCRVSKEKPEKSDASATSHLPQAASRSTFSAEIRGVREEKKERDGRFWRKSGGRDQKEAKPELIETNTIVSDKKSCRFYDGASPSFGVYCRRSASVSSGRPPDGGNKSSAEHETVIVDRVCRGISSVETRESKLRMEGPVDQRWEGESGGKKEKKGRGLLSRPAGVASLLNVSWRNPVGHHQKHVQKVTP